MWNPGGEDDSGSLKDVAILIALVVAALVTCAYAPATLASADREAVAAHQTVDHG